MVEIVEGHPPTALIEETRRLLIERHPEWKGRIIFRPNELWVMSVTIKNVGTVYCEVEKYQTAKEWADAVMDELA